jgi:group I intron endonuclease
MSYSVYKLTFPNGKVYIGNTGTKPEKRWNKGSGYLHKKANGEYHQPRIANAIIEFGWDNIKREIIFDGLSKLDAENKEVELIIKHRSNDERFGYNIVADKHSEETKRKISESMKGDNNPNYGLHISKEQKLKISESLNDKKKMVLCVETDIIYESIAQAVKETGINRSKISDVCHGRRKTAGGFCWEFVK